MPGGSTEPNATPSAPARSTSDPLVAGSAASTSLSENDLLIAGILLFTFCSAGAAALYAFGRRQSSRDGQLATVAAVAAGPAVVPDWRSGHPSEPVPDDEAGVPRWLRASVRAERFWTPEPTRPDRDLRERRAAAEFDEMRGDAVAMVVRGEAVNVLDGPNASYASIVGRLQTGDEVLVLGMDGDWIEVRTPRGATGWLPLTTLMPLDGRLPVAAEEPAQESDNRRAAKRSRSGGAGKRRPAPSS